MISCQGANYTIILGPPLSLVPSPSERSRQCPAVKRLLSVCDSFLVANYLLFMKKNIRQTQLNPVVVVRLLVFMLRMSFKSQKSPRIYEKKKSSLQCAHWNENSNDIIHYHPVFKLNAVNFPSPGGDR